VQQSFSKLLVGAVVALGLTFLVLPFIPVPNPPLAGWGAFLGRFHPVVVHFPIVLVLIPLLLEGAARLWREGVFYRLVPIFWGLAALSCMAAVVAGYLLYASGEYGGDLIRQHLWAGIVVVVLVLGTVLLSVQPKARSSPLWYGLYLGGAVLANAVVIYAGHLGGSLTHGEGFLTDAFPGWSYAVVAVDSRPREELLVYHDLIKPALETRCMSCHNPQKIKGKLDLASLQTIERGGESGKAMFVPGQPDSSELYRRVTLPFDHDDRMPPDGKPSLTSDEITILRWWIEEGAGAEMRLGEGPSDLLRQTVIDRYLPRLAIAQRKRLRERRRVAELYHELRGEAGDLALVVEIDPETDSTLFALSMQFPPGRVDDRTLARLEPQAENISKLSLVSSDVTDEGLRRVASMRNLRTLILQKTRIDGSGLGYLQTNTALEVLNLSHTALNDSGIIHLLKMPSLREVYVYNTAVSDSILEAVRAHLPDTEVLRVEGAAY